MRAIILVFLFIIAAVPVAVVGQRAPSAPSLYPEVRASLSSYEEDPTLSTAGTGSFLATLTIATQVDYQLSYGSLQGTASAAHIHLGTRATTGGVIAFLCGGGGKAACPSSGTVSGSIIAADVIGPSGQGIAAGEFGEFRQALLSGATYVNVHTDVFPGGEIRGQISRVDTPVK